MSVKPESAITDAPITKREYLEANSHRVSFEADGEALWMAYDGSRALLGALWGMYGTRGLEWGVAPEVAALMLNFAVDKQTASAAMGVPARRRVVIG